MTRMLKEAVSGILSEKEIEQLYGAFDQIGDIVIIRIPDSLLDKKRIIGNTLLQKIKSSNTIFCQTTPVDGDYRVRSLELIAGEDKTHTVYKEHGCSFTVDVENVFFSPRLSNERLRIAYMIQQGETIINMFGGVGIFSIIAAKKKQCHVVNIDINPIAAKLCQENIKKNQKKMVGTVESIQGDAQEIIDSRLESKADRALMLLPERSDEFLNAAVKACKSGSPLGSFIHYYCHVHADKRQNVPEIAKQHFNKLAGLPDSPIGHHVHEIADSKMVRAVGPRYYQAVVDIKIFKD